MRYAALYADLEQATAGCGVVVVIGQRLFYRLRHDQAASEMDNARNPVRLNDRLHALHIVGITFDKGDIGWDCVPTTRREIIENDDPVPCCAKGQDGVAADVTGTSGDENGHRIT